jgi:hypothetical protein
MASFQCGGYLNWTEVSKETRFKKVELPSSDVYQIAVAANSGKISSGMLWASCTVLHDKVVSKMKIVNVNRAIDSNSLKVNWHLDCSDKVGIVTGYKIYYCPVNSVDSDCLNGKDQHIKVGALMHNVELHNLTPYTLYRIGVSVLTKAGEGEVSDYIFKRTKRDRPEARPTELHAAVLDRNALELFWNPPEVPNGPIGSYEIKYSYKNFKGQTVKNRAVVEGHRRTFKAKDLVFNVEYDLAIRACTFLKEENVELCSEEWAMLRVKTLIGRKFWKRKILVKNKLK